MNDPVGPMEATLRKMREHIGKGKPSGDYLQGYLAATFVRKSILRAGKANGLDLDQTLDILQKFNTEIFSEWKANKVIKKVSRRDTPL